MILKILHTTRIFSVNNRDKPRVIKTKRNQVETMRLGFLCLIYETIYFNEDNLKSRQESED